MEKFLFNLGSIIAAINEKKYHIGETVNIGKGIQLLVITEHSFAIRGKNGKELNFKIPQRSSPSATSIPRSCR